MAKRKPSIPDDYEGYAVNRDTGTVHTRYAGNHAGASVQRTRTRAGLDALIDGLTAKPCQVCYPAGMGTVTAGSDEPQEGQQRRVASVPRPE